MLDLLLPGAGFLFCLLIWIGLSWPAKIAGATWLIVGVAVLAIHTKHFRQPLVMTDPAAFE